MQEVNRTSVIKRICLVNKSLVEVQGKAVICSTRDIARPVGELFSRRGVWGRKYEEFQAGAGGVGGDGFIGRFIEPGLFTTAPTCSAAACSDTASSDTACSAATGATSTESTRARGQSGRRQYAYAQ